MKVCTVPGLFVPAFGGPGRGRSRALVSPDFSSTSRSIASPGPPRYPLSLLCYAYPPPRGRRRRRIHARVFAARSASDSRSLRRSSEGQTSPAVGPSRLAGVARLRKCQRPLLTRATRLSDCRLPCPSDEGERRCARVPLRDRAMLMPPAPVTAPGEAPGQQLPAAQKHVEAPPRVRPN